jgi:hypothetical protein
MTTIQAEQKARELANGIAKTYFKANEGSIFKEVSLKYQKQLTEQIIKELELTLLIQKADALDTKWQEIKALQEYQEHHFNGDVGYIHICDLPEFIEQLKQVLEAAKQKGFEL